MHHLIYEIRFFSMRAMHRKAEECQPRVMDSKVTNHRCISALEKPLHPADPKQPLQMPHRYVTDVFALSQLNQELSVLSTLPALL